MIPELVRIGVGGSLSFSFGVHFTVVGCSSYFEWVCI